MTKSQHQYLLHDESGDLEIAAPYRAEFVGALKDLVDPESRRWLPRERVWIIDGAYEKYVLQLLHRYFPFVGNQTLPDWLDQTKPGAAAVAPEPAEEIQRLKYELAEERRRRVAADELSRKERDLRVKLQIELNTLRQQQRIRDIQDSVRRGWGEAGAGGSSGGGAADLSAAYRVLHLMPDAPTELVEAAYRRLSQLHHPDIGGNPDIMKRLNNARDRIRRA